MSHFILVFASFFVMFLMCAGVMILRAPLMDFPDADEEMK